MLYSILPPIVVVLSLVGIIVFLVKKFSKIKEACQNDAIENQEKENFGNEVSFENKNIEKKAGIWKKIEGFFLVILEKTIRRLKTLFLKLEVKSGTLSGKIRMRRNRENSLDKENIFPDKQEEKILEKVIGYKTQKNFKETAVSENKQSLEAGSVKNNWSDKKKKVLVEEEKIVEPMISKNVTLPKTSLKTKNKLEELLIERVATNPKDIEAYERLGEYYMEIENYNDAKECFKQVMKLNPLDRNVKYKIRRLERLLGE
jgi:tetratricopeptide (TPR) repeat protein